jgi:hypothetical protein
MPVTSSTSSEVPASVPAVELRRVLRMRDLVMLVIGTVIGSGIFLVPGAVLRPLGGSVSLALLVWTTGGAYGELTAGASCGRRSLYFHQRLLWSLSGIPLRLDAFLRDQFWICRDTGGRIQQLFSSNSTCRGQLPAA